MPIIPNPKVEQLQFCESHWPIWQAQAAAIGLTAGQVTAFKTLTTSARAAYDAAQNAKQAARAAITAQNAALAQATANAADLIRVIKGFAELTSNPNAIYSLAQIPPPATPVPASAPGKPENFLVTLEPSGAITLTWDAANSAAGTGAFFNISRKLPGQTAFTIVGGSPGSTAETRRMTFTDYTIPTTAAQTGAQYIVQGRRGTMMGAPGDAITVQFVDGMGMNVVGSGLKMAA